MKQRTMQQTQQRTIQQTTQTPQQTTQTTQQTTQQTQDQYGQVDGDSEGDSGSLEGHKYPFIICPSEWGINCSNNINSNREYILGEEYSRSLQFSSEA